MAAAVSNASPFSRRHAGSVGSGSILETSKHLRSMAAAAVSNASPCSRRHVRSVGSGSILETSKHLRSTGKDKLPKELRVSATDASTIGLDEWKASAEFEVIDLSLLQTDRDGVVKQLHKAVTECGLFQIVNHGFPLEVLQDAQAQGLKFFELPSEVKEKAGLSGTTNSGLGTYVGDNTKQNISSLYWAESLAFSLDYLERMVSQVWPDGNEKFTYAVTKYSSGVDTIGKQLFELIAEGLGLSTNFFAEHVDGKKVLRWNFYPACPRPTDIMGAAAHTDPVCMTLLLQDKVGGLQIEKDGEWIGVRPIEGALVVNIGDTLHAWTNAICKSVLHRVVVNKEVHRLSIAAFLNVDGQFPISAPEELIDDSHPRRYKTATLMEYIGYAQQIRRESKHTVRNGVSILEEKFRFEK